LISTIKFSTESSTASTHLASGAYTRFDFSSVKDLDALYNEVSSRPYRYNKPVIEQAQWGDRCFTVTDPFSNRVLFNEQANT
jgi:uncharacterized glyoxalase superfamily protein PhnB